MTANCDWLRHLTPLSGVNIFLTGRFLSDSRRSPLRKLGAGEVGGFLTDCNGAIVWSQQHLVDMRGTAAEEHTFQTENVDMFSASKFDFNIYCCVFVSAPARVSAVTTETVVGVAGRKVMLPCRSEAVNQKGVEVCWGRGEPSLFTCHNAVIYTAGGQVTYRKSYR